MHKIVNRTPYGPGNPELHEFDSWGSYLDHCENVKPTKPANPRRSRQERNSEFDGGASWDEALDLARNGWAEGESKVGAICRRLEDKIAHRIVRDDWNYDVEGQAFDVARYLQGEPEHWSRPEESYTITGHGERHVKIVFNGTSAWFVSAKAIIIKGAAIAALVEMLEYANQRCEVWLVMSVGSRLTKNLTKATFATATRVKAYDQPLEISRLAFALAHPASLRRLHFAAAEGAHKSIVEGVSAPCSYGRACEFNELDDTSVYVPCSGKTEPNADWTSQEYAETWVLAKLAKQGIVLRED